MMNMPACFLVNLGHIMQEHGKRAEAVTVFERGLTIARAISHRPAISMLLGNLATVETDPRESS